MLMCLAPLLALSLDFAFFQEKPHCVTAVLAEFSYAFILRLRKFHSFDFLEIFLKNTCV